MKQYSILAAPKTYIMKKRKLFLLAVATLTFACKKESKPSDDKVIGSWSAYVQIKMNEDWPVVNLDSVQQHGNVNYVFNRDFSGSITKVDVVFTTPPVPRPIDISKWFPAAAGTIVYNPSVELNHKLKTERIFWQFNSQEKQLLILDSLHTLTEIWPLDEINDRYITSVPVLTPLILPFPSTDQEIKRDMRIMLIRK
ncbi:hypothetical protein CTE07_06380 [Chitinophaga terrae (ex Kim and Jung 2007)]|nr:hypothetical protein CTE07_06380 [Chitinophaga terrae (ex Kim and Jung 2007)]